MNNNNGRIKGHKKNKFRDIFSFSFSLFLVVLHFECISYLHGDKNGEVIYAKKKIRTRIRHHISRSPVKATTMNTRR